MRTRLALGFVAFALFALLPSPSATAGGDFQPDGWIKLCGQSLGCVIDPPPHP